ncbi:hypothetical protein Tco_0482889, partial [Tanacetum coccineum]
ASHNLQGRPWQHDVDAIHRRNKNLYMFNWYQKNIAIIPNATRPPDLKTLIICPLVEGCENSGASSFQVRE